MRATIRILCGLAATSMLAIAVGCSSGGGSGSEADAQEQLEKLTEQVRTLAEKVDRLEQSESDRERRTAQVDQDIMNRINEMVQQAVGRSGRRAPRFVRPAEPVVRVVKKPYMGFDGQNIDPDIAEQLKLVAKTGVIVTNVREGTPAAVAGVKKNDVVQSLGGNAIENFDELKTALGKCKPNETVEMLIQRGDKKLKLTIKLGERTERIGG